jgi:hypothetical protein
MTSERRIEANRRNARRSTGPKTAAGKAVSRLNAQQHGLTGTLPALLPEDDPAAYAAHRDALYVAFAPGPGRAVYLVEDVVRLTWRIARAERIEVGVLTQQMLARRENLAYREAFSLEQPADRDAWCDAWRTQHETAKAREAAAQDAQLADLPVLGYAYNQEASTLDKLQRYEAQLRRALERTLADLACVQAQEVADRDAGTPAEPDVTAMANAAGGGDAADVARESGHQARDEGSDASGDDAAAIAGAGHCYMQAFR